MLFTLRKSVLGVSAFSGEALEDDIPDEEIDDAGSSSSSGVHEAVAEHIHKKIKKERKDD